MKFCLYTTALSAHQLPVYQRVRGVLGKEHCRYICEKRDGSSVQTKLGDVNIEWMTAGSSDAKTWLEHSEVLYVGGVRPLDLFEYRATKGLKTFYQSERWFKPLFVGVGCWGCVGSVPGWVRLLVPSYRRMVKRFVKWANSDPGARVLAIGPWAKKDFLRMGVKPEKVVDWGYFVAPSTEPQVANDKSKVMRDGTLKVLWAGRDIPLKHVRDIEAAVKLANKNIANSSGNLNLKPQPITFTKLTGVTPAAVRAAMRAHDTFVFASNAYEGWGAVVSEALEERMNAIGTWECGAPPTLLPKERLYHCGDVKALASLLEKEYHCKLPSCSIGEWTANKAVERLLAL